MSSGSSSDSEEPQELQPLNTKKLQRYFKALLRPELPEMLQSFGPQRWLLVYFSVCGLDLLSPEGMTLAETLGEEMVDALEAAVLACLVPGLAGGIGIAPLPDVLVYGPSLTQTHCALHILKTCGRLKAVVERGDIDVEALMTFVVSHQWGDETVAHHGERGSGVLAEMAIGGFSNIRGSIEVDVRFSYSAAMIAWLLRSTVGGEGGCSTLAEFAVKHGLDVERCVVHLKRSQTWEGGFGGLPGQEAHGGMTFCAVAAQQLLGAWVTGGAAEAAVRRYCISRIDSRRWDDVVPDAAEVIGACGFQGRPNKDCDTCYTYWHGGTLSMIQATSLFDTAPVATFVVSCNTACPAESGGISKEDAVPADPLHSCLGLSGLAAMSPQLMEEQRAWLGVEALRPIDALFGVSTATAESW